MKQILVTKEKGGVASTTTAVNLAYALVQRHMHVLLVDLDTRGDCAPCLGLDPAPRLSEAVAGTLATSGGCAEWIAPTVVGVDVLVTNSSATRAALARLDYVDVADVAMMLRGWGEGYDVVIYDTSAASGVLRRAAMLVADVMVVPTRVEALGMADIAALIGAYNGRGRVLVLPVAYRRLSVHEYNLGALEAAYGAQVCDVIPDRVAVIESHSAMEPVMAYAPDNDASVAYGRFAQRVLDALGGEWS